MDGNITPQQPTDNTTPAITPEPENMEVHYEPHFKHHHHKKHLAEYAKEFLMIFFAVFLGFLAENLREHIAEKNKEKEYVRGFTADLKKDNLEIKNALKDNTLQMSGLDSLADLLQTDLHDMRYRKRVYILIRSYAANYSSFISTDGTLQQIKSTGDLKLMYKNGAADSLLNYYSVIEDAQYQLKSMPEFLKDLIKVELASFDFNILYRQKNLDDPKIVFPPLDETKLPAFKNNIVLYRAIIKGSLNMMKNALQKNEVLQKFLNQTYHLKDE